MVTVREQRGTNRKRAISVEPVMRRGSAALVATLAVAATGCGNGVVDGPDRNAPSTPSDPAAHAQAEADRLLSLVRVPVGATQVDHSPAKILDRPAETPGTSDLVDEHRWWTVSSDAQTTLEWLTKHGVEHLKSSGSGSSGGPSGVTEYTLTFNDRAPAGINSEELQLDVAPMSDRSSAIRADAQVAWLVNKPDNETIPSSIDRVVVSAYKMSTQIGHRVLTGGQARRLVQIINSLPPALRGDHGCAADFGYRLHVVAGPVVLDEDVACRDIEVTNGGSKLPALEGKQQFIHAVASSMGLPDYLTG